MRLTFSTLTAALATALLLASSASASYADSCYYARVRGQILSAECEDPTGKRVSTQLDLNTCVSFVDHTLICGGQGGFADRCNVDSCHSIGTTLGCDCGLGHTSYVGLSLCVQNNDGQLGC